MANRRLTITDDLLGPAVEAFWTKGYAATSMQEIVERTGANRAALYSKYGDKRAIFIASLERYIGEIRNRLIERLLAQDRPLDIVQDFLMQFAEAASDGYGDRGCLINNTAVEVAPHDREVWQIIQAAHLDLENFFALMVEQAKAEGSTSAEVDTRNAARGLLACATGLSILVRTRPDPELLKSVVHDAVDRLR